MTSPHVSASGQLCAPPSPSFFRVSARSRASSLRYSLILRFGFLIHISLKLRRPVCKPRRGSFVTCKTIGKYIVCPEEKFWRLGVNRKFVNFPYLGFCVFLCICALVFGLTPDKLFNSCVFFSCFL